jgi:hypothetical protein
MIVLLRLASVPVPRLTSATLDRLKNLASKIDGKFVRLPRHTSLRARQCALIQTSSTKNAASGAFV